MPKASDQVEEWEKENPDDVDDMPVQATEIYGRVIPFTEPATQCQQEQPQDDTPPDDHVNAVQPSHRVVNRKETMGIDR